MSDYVETPLRARRRMTVAAEDYSFALQSSDWETAVENTAVHEAGHAIASSLLRIPFEYVTIEHITAHSNGRVSYVYKVHEWANEFPQGSSVGGVHHASNGCISLMAGPAAQLRDMGCDANLQTSAEGDRATLSFISGIIALRIRERRGNAVLSAAIQQWAWREACLMMANPRVWNAVQSLASHLLEHETATEAAVAEIVEAAQIRYRVKRYRADAASTATSALGEGRANFSTQE